MLVWLFDNESGGAAEAELTRMTDEHIAALNATWVREFHRRQESGARDQDFLMWKTGVKYMDLLSHRESVRAYVVARSGDVQGVLALQESAEASRLQKGERVLIVRYLAAAPWNRPGQSGGGRYRRTGTVLLGQAVSDSMAAGCAGRLGLHSLSGSDDFYRKIGFEDLGPDPAERGLRYFELSVLQAARLLPGTALMPDSGPSVWPSAQPS